MPILFRSSHRWCGCSRHARLGFAENPSAALADFDEALYLIEHKILSVLIDTELLANIYKDRAIALVKMGKFSEAETSEMESLKLIEADNELIQTWSIHDE